MFRLRSINRPEGLPLPSFLVAVLLLVAVPTARLAALPVVCPFRNLFGVRCLGCGMTRALSLLFHFRAADAWAMNPLVAFVFPWLLAMAARELKSLAGFFAGPAEFRRGL
jgi:hypothetical protein